MEKLIRKIEEEGKKSVSEIDSETKKLVNEILSEAEEKASKEKEKILLKGKRRAELEFKRIVSAANIEANRKRVQAVDSLATEVYNAALKSFSELRKNKNYLSILKEMLSEAAETFSEKEIVLRAAKQDAPKLKSFKAKGKKIRVVSDNGILAGAVLESNDGLVKVDCTFETLLERKWPELKKLALEGILA
jgi:vacuolar-type H+-ATPase subunit E/Vma4